MLSGTMLKNNTSFPNKGRKKFVAPIAKDREDDFIERKMEEDSILQNTNYGNAYIDRENDLRAAMFGG